MAKKLFLNISRAINAALNRNENVAPSSSRTSSVSGTNIQLPFQILDETSKSFPKFNATGCSLLIKFNNPREKQEPMTYLKECITALTEYLVKEVTDRDLVGLRIRNTENLQDKVIGISLRRRDQLKTDVVWSVLGKVIQNNARFALTDRLKVWYTTGGHSPLRHLVFTFHGLGLFLKYYFLYVRLRPPPSCLGVMFINSSLGLFSKYYHLYVKLYKGGLTRRHIVYISQPGAVFKILLCLR
jgi:hypothetical protein